MIDIGLQLPNIIGLKEPFKENAEYNTIKEAFNGVAEYNRVGEHLKENAV